MSVHTVAFPAVRRGTYTFLRESRRTSHVYLFADVDATRMQAARQAAGGTLSYAGFVVKAAADAIAAGYPQARSVLRDGIRPRIAVLDDVHVKVLFDKEVDGERCVLSGVVPAAQAMSVHEVQDVIDGYKKAPADGTGPFATALRVARLPLPLLRPLWRLALRDPRRRAALQGTVAVTSVGHAAVRAILPQVNGPVGFGIGRIETVPAIRGGQVAAVAQFTLSLSFDHRVLDGAAAAELLAAVKHRLENWGSR